MREYLTDVEPASYVLFVDGKPVGIVEAKRKEEGHKPSTTHPQAPKNISLHLYLDVSPCISTCYSTYLVPHIQYPITGLFCARLLALLPHLGLTPFASGLFCASSFRLSGTFLLRLWLRLYASQVSGVINRILPLRQ